MVNPLGTILVEPGAFFAGLSNERMGGVWGVM